MDDSDDTDIPARYQADNRIGCKYTTVPFELHDDPKVDAFGLAVYSALFTVADFGTGENARASRETLASRAGCCERAVDARLDMLDRRGWITREPRQGKTTLYTVHFTRQVEAQETLAGNAGVPPQEMQGTPAADAHDRAPFTKHPNQHPSTEQMGGSEREAIRENEDGTVGSESEPEPTTDVPPEKRTDLEAFKAEYPETDHTRSDAAVSRAWAEAVTTTDPGKILSAVESYRNDYIRALGKRPQYVMNPVRFLRERAWENDWYLRAGRYRTEDPGSSRRRPPVYRYLNEVEPSESEEGKNEEHARRRALTRMGVDAMEAKTEAVATTIAQVSGELATEDFRTMDIREQRAKLLARIAGAVDEEEGDGGFSELHWPPEDEEPERIKGAA